MVAPYEHTDSCSIMCCCQTLFAMGGINGLANQNIEEFERLYDEFAQMLLDSISQRIYICNPYCQSTLI